jgi:hypothetical protein
MAKSQLDTTISDWQKRTRTLAGMGVSPDKFSELAQTDINKVAQGGTGLTDQEVYDAALSGGSGQPVIQDPSSGTSPLDILGNVPKDLGGIVSGFIPGIINTAHHLPSEVTNLGHYAANTLGRSGASEKNWELSHGYEDTSADNLSALAAGFRNITKNPLVSSFAPGISDLAQATTSSGRKNMERHPVGSLLDVMPLISEGTSAFSNLALGPEDEAGEVGSEAQAALREGHPVKALIRSIGPLNEVRSNFLESLNIDPASLSITRKGAEVMKQAKIDQDQWIEDNVTPILDKYFKLPDGSIDDARLARVTQLMQDPRTISQIPDSEQAEDQAIVNVLKEPTAKVRDLGLSTGAVRSIKWNGRDLTFSTEGSGGLVLRSFDKVQSLENRLGRLQSDLDTAEARHIDQFGDDKGPIEPNSPRHLSLQTLAKKQKSVDRLTKTLQKAKGTYNKLLQRTVPADFQPMVVNDIKDQISSRMTADVDEDGNINGNLGLNEAFKDLQMGRMDRIFNAPDGYWSEANLNKIKLEAAKTWQDMAKAGYDPTWVHTTDLTDMDRMNSLRPLSHAAKPGFVKDKTLNLSPGLSNDAAALSQAATEFLRLKASEEYIQNALVPQTLTTDEVMSQIQPEVDKVMKGSKGYVSEANIRQHLLQTKYTKLSDEFTGGLTSPVLKPLMDEDRYLPNYLAKASREFTNPKAPSELGQIVRGGNRVFKTSVMAFSPTFLAHHLLGGTLSLIGRSGYEEFLPQTLAKAWDMATHADERMPVAISQGLDTVSNDELTSWMTGTKAGHLLHGAGKVAGFNFKMATLVSNMQRAMAYLGEESRGLKEGLSDDAAREQGIVHANKVFVDWNGMSAVERNAIRTAIPFYGFTKQILRYALTYPIDHPYRASIISNLAESEQQDWQSGLPRSFMDLFMFGKGDDKTAVNYSTVNPYRDIGNYFTLTGLISSLNPFAQGTLTAAGLDTLSATPELYPAVTYNTTTGQLEAKRPSGGALSFLQSVIPEVGTLDHFLQLSSSMRRLATTNPEGYRKQLFSSLGIPFVPYSVNVPYSEEQAELNRFKYAQGQVSSAMKSGSIGPVSNLNLVPYLDELYTPQQLQSIIQQMTGQQQTVALPGLKGPESIKTTTPKKTAKKGAAQVGLEQAEQALNS